MKTRAGLLMPGIAMLTIVAILATGFVLGQLRGGAPGVTLLGALQQFAAGAEPSDAVVQADGFIVADAGLSYTGGGQWQQPSGHPASSNQPAQVAAEVGPAAQQANAPVAGPESGVLEHTADSDDVQVDGEEPVPTSPQSDPAGGDADLAAPSGGSTESAEAVAATTSRDEMTTPATLPSVDSAARDGQAVLVAAVPDDEENESARRQEADGED
jgi:hypothetical protein